MSNSWGRSARASRTHGWIWTGLAPAHIKRKWDAAGKSTSVGSRKISCSFFDRSMTIRRADSTHVPPPSPDSPRCPAICAIYYGPAAVPPYLRSLAGRHIVHADATPAQLVAHALGSTGQTRHALMRDATPRTRREVGPSHHSSHVCAHARTTY